MTETREKQPNPNNFEQNLQPNIDALRQTIARNTARLLGPVLKKVKVSAQRQGVDISDEEAELQELKKELQEINTETQEQLNDTGSSQTIERSPIAKEVSAPAETQPEFAPIPLQLDLNDPHLRAFSDYVIKCASNNPDFVSNLGKNPNLDIPLALQEMARKFSGYVPFEDGNYNYRTTQGFISWITQGNYQVEQTIWKNFQIRSAVFDAILARAEVGSPQAETSDTQKTLDLLERY